MKSYLYVALASVFSITAINAQGCSDAGVCSIDGHYNDEVEVTKNRVEVGTVFGAGDADITYIAPYVAYTRNFNAKWAASLKITSSILSTRKSSLSADLTLKRILSAVKSSRCV